ncbi:MAG: hypothetical protein KGN01_07180 [Patescibacteria group bacterium]|nr:hypothetical protein [Patescibacteria group bacterium]
MKNNPLVNKPHSKAASFAEFIFLKFPLIGIAVVALIPFLLCCLTFAAAIEVMEWKNKSGKHLGRI